MTGGARSRMRRRVARGVLGVLAAASALAPGTLAAREPGSPSLPPSVTAREIAARQRSARASALYDAGKYDDALRLFLAAYDLAPLSDVLFNIGLAREKMLDFEGCVRDFRRYLREGNDPALQARARERLAHCEGATQLVVHATSIPPGAAVTISDRDGKQLRFAGRTPLETKLTLGAYVMRAELPGFENADQRFVLDIDEPREIDFPLRKLALLAVDADTTGASAALGDETPVPLPLRREVPAGAYRVTVTKPGHRTVSRDVRLGVGEQSTLVVALPALPRIHALALRTEPAASVIVDGQPVPDTRRLALEEGPHHVEVTAPPARPYVGDVVMPGNRDVAFDVTLAHPRTLRQRATIGGLAVGAVAATVIGAVFGVKALHDQSAYERMPSLDLADEGGRHAATADVMFGAALVLAAASITAYVLTAPGESSGAMR
jgi:hypothetical protein